MKKKVLKYMYKKTNKTDTHKIVPKICAKIQRIPTTLGKILDYQKNLLVKRS